MGAAMEMQNVTVSLPRELVRRARHVAVERGMSLSKLLAECVTRSLHHEEAYEAARTRALARMDAALPLGVGETPGWTRDDLHER